ncbi:MAG: hypothetical protein Q7S21_03330 [archaeon]|nr:hypothetical protein [archaeon]
MVLPKIVIVIPIMLLLISGAFAQSIVYSSVFDAPSNFFEKSLIKNFGKIHLSFLSNNSQQKTIQVDETKIQTKKEIPIEPSSTIPIVIKPIKPIDKPHIQVKEDTPKTHPIKLIHPKTKTIPSQPTLNYAVHPTIPIPAPEHPVPVPAPVFPEYFHPIVLHRIVKNCSDDSPVTINGVTEQIFPVGQEIGYYNFTGSDRKQEQCFNDGTFDTYYFEWLEHNRYLPIIITLYQNDAEAIVDYPTASNLNKFSFNSNNMDSILNELYEKTGLSLDFIKMHYENRIRFK